jgi:Pvc16 N-terminal domain
MIDVALAFIRQVLDNYLANSLAIAEGVVVLNNLVDANGASPQKNQNSIVITLINLEYETTKQLYGGQVQNGNQVDRLNPAVRFNLDILVSANFDDYAEALKFLTASIGFFQENQAFTRATAPTLPPGIAALTVEIENSPFYKAHNLWTALGAKYLPSMIYKIRQVNVQSGQVKGSASAVQGSSSSVSPAS